MDSDVSTITGSNGFKWKLTSPSKTKTFCHNIIRFSHGLKQKYHIVSILDCWDLFFTNDMLQEILNCANREARRYYYSQRQKPWKDIDKLNAFFGLRLLAGVEKQWDIAQLEIYF